MATFIAVFILMMLVVAAMAIGVLLGRKPIAGSCGGMAAIGMESECEVCGGNTSLCDGDNDGESNSQTPQQPEFEDATQTHRANTRDS